MKPYAGWTIVFLLVLSACSPAPNPVAQRPRPNIYLITADALRPDRISCYGYQRNTTPFLDELAGSGLRFSTVSSTCSWTAPAMASLFSGHYPRTHAVRHGFYVRAQSVLMYQEMFGRRIRTMAEMLKDDGYYTIGVSTNPHLIAHTGFHRGFDDFYEDHSLRDALDAGTLKAGQPLESLLINAEKTNRITLSMLDRKKNDKPVFLWVHYMDPHWPYFPRDPWAQQFSGHRKLQLGTLYDDSLPLQNQDFDTIGRRKLVRDLSVCYDSEIAFMDKWLKRLVDRLPDIENSLLIFTSDHGEAFLEHEHLSHGFTLHREEVRIPLIVHLPGAGRPIGVIDEPVGIVDLMPTVAAFIGVDPPAGLPGRNLLPRMRGEITSLPTEYPLISELNRFNRDETAVESGGWKFIEDRENDKAYLFNAAEDPFERIDRALSEPDRVADMRSLADRWRAEVVAGVAETAPQQLDPEAKQRIEEGMAEHLRALGYVE